MYINRQLEDIIKPFLKRKEVLAIIGPRQSGKTTFLKHLKKQLKQNGKKVKYITFEKRQDLELFTNDIESFRFLLKPFEYIFIDEFQYSETGGQKLKYLYDTTEIKFIISGSSSLELTFQTGKYMVGRMFDFLLMPFSFREFLSFREPELRALISGKKSLGREIMGFRAKSGFGPEINKRLSETLEEYAVYGGYPAVALAKTEKEKNKILGSITENYILKDINSLLRLATEDELMKIAKFLAPQIGNLIKYEELSNISGLRYPEVLKHLKILEKTFIIKLIRPYFSNRRAELVRNPKNYYIDLGFRNYLISDFRPLELRNDRGAVMENYAFNLLFNSGAHGDLKYWRTKSGAEVDFIVEREQNIYPIEVKYTSKRMVGKSFYSFINKFNPKIGIILTKDYLAEEKINNTLVKFIPLGYF